MRQERRSCNARRPFYTLWERRLQFKGMCPQKIKVKVWDTGQVKVGHRLPAKIYQGLAEPGRSCTPESL